MRALHRKLVRDLWKLRGQVFSIALLVACGVMAVVGMRSTFESVRDARDRYYAQYRFAHIFASLKRAPESVASRIAAIPGVGGVQTRVVLQATLDVPRKTEPAVGQFVSIPSSPVPMLNDLHILSGRYVAADRSDEVLVSSIFAAANNLVPGDTLGAVINGRWQRLHISGVATSPEYVYEIGGGGIFVDNSTFGILWMRREALAAAAGVLGSFNNVTLLLAPGADERPVLLRLDEILSPYGGIGAVSRDDQPSNQIISNELSQLSAIARVFPLFFLGIAAFLLNVVLSRLIDTQRTEIGALKAFGYTDTQVGVHFLGFAVASVAVGALIGIALGTWLGSTYTDLYRRFFGFPDLVHKVGWGSAVAAIGISGGAAMLGALAAVRKATALPPAEAMRPPAPTRFRPLFLERIGFKAPGSPGFRMVLRNLERRPFRSLASTVGIGLASSVLVAGMFPFDAVNELIDIQFRRVQRDDLTVAFNSPVSARARAELLSLNDAAIVELTRTTLVRFRNGQISRTAPLTGLESNSILRTMVDARGQSYALPADGAIFTESLLRVLGARIGDTLRVELMESGGEERFLVATGSYDESTGFGAYLSRPALNRLLREGDLATGALIRSASGTTELLSAQLRERPGVSGVASRASLLAYFERTISESILISAGIVIFAAVVIAAGVVYNGSRIALAERGRELATLRVLGFSRGEVSGFFLSEQGVLTLMGLPLGAAGGLGIATVLSNAFRTERFSFPVVIHANTYLFAAGVVLLATSVVALLVRRRIDRLDMIATLKVGE